MGVLNIGGAPGGFHHHHFRNFVSFGIVAPDAYADDPER